MKLDELIQTKKVQKDVIKIQTNVYVNSRKELVIQKTIRQMRSLSESDKGYRVFEEELSEIGAHAYFTSLEGIDSLSDGLYEMASI